MKDYYAILGVERNATGEEIRAAYLALSKSLHPDVNPQGAGLMRAVNEAYETLKDPKKRRDYNLKQKVREFVPAASAVAEDGSFDLLNLARVFVPAHIIRAASPVLERKLSEHGINAKAATAEQVFEAFGLLKKKKRGAKSV